ncbi:MAG: DNA translocase FtsK [Acidobacteriota bacterium]|nr:DNA translocase FtsK [Acidobacteriota bacterium]
MSAIKKPAGNPPRMAPDKVRELVAVALALVGLLALLSLLSYRPDDPSFLHQTTAEVPAANLIGPLGAQLAAFGFGFFGLTALLVPLLLVWAAWRRARRRGAEKVVGRGIGAVVLVVSLPALLALTLPEVAWRGATLRAGGVLGDLLAGGAGRVAGFTGALFLLLAGVVVGAALLVQSTLGELLARWRERLVDAWQGLVLRRARRRERREREDMRERVVAKHRRRAAEQQGAPEGEIDLPLRVQEKSGDGRFAVRRVTAPREEAPRLPSPPAAGVAPHSAAARSPAPPAPAAEAQREIPFPRAARAAKGALPPLDLLRGDVVEQRVEENELVRLGQSIQARCAEFGVQGTIDGISPGPVITVYEFQPAPGVKVSQIVNLQDDLALALRAESVRIERMPGRSTLGIEVPNDERSLIRLGWLLADERFRKARSPLTMALGTTIHGAPYYADLATAPHLLVAGATGAGKSVGLQSMITSILYKARREEVQFIFIDPKRIELGAYKDIPHLKAEVVVEPKKASNALRWAVGEMERRYRLLAEVHVRSIDFYNRAIGDPEVRKRLALSEGEGEFGSADLTPLPYYVIVIDELADLMMVAAADVEASIARLAQMARAVGIHLIIATQRPSVDVLTGTIKANFPCRLAYATASRHDSRTILDAIGAERLLGKGDLLFMPAGTSRPIRLHGAYVTEQETAGLVRWLKKQGPPQIDSSVLEEPGEGRSAGEGGDNDDDMFEEAARLVIAERKASASFLQRRLRVGFSRAARLIDMMEQDGLLGPPQGSKPREVLVAADYFEEIDRAGEGV